MNKTDLSEILLFMETQIQKNNWDVVSNALSNAVVNAKNTESVVLVALLRCTFRIRHRLADSWIKLRDETQKELELRNLDSKSAMTGLFEVISIRGDSNGCETGEEAVEGRPGLPKVQGSN